MAPRPVSRRPSAHRPGQPLADDPRLSREPESGRTWLGARTGSPLAQFLESLAGAWTEPRVLSMYDTLPSAMFEPEFRDEVERRVRLYLWDTIARENLMPLAVPATRWTWFPFGGPDIHPEQAATIADLPPPAYIEPDADLPENGCAVCLGTVTVVGLPVAEHRPGTEGPLRPPLRSPGR